MEKKVTQAGDRDADALNRNIGQQAEHAPSDAPGQGGPKRRTWENYAEDYRLLSEELVEASRLHQDALAQLGAKDAELKRVKNQRLKDLDRLAAVSRTRDMLEKRAAAQMAKVAAALARPAAAGATPAFQPATDAGARVPLAPSAYEATGLATRLEEKPSVSLGWSEGRWWQHAIRAGQKAHKEQRPADAQLFFEVALLTKQTPSLWQQLGHVLRETGQFLEAEVAYRRALRANPQDGELLFLSGYCLEMAGNPSGAVPLYEAALAAQPQLAARYEHLRHFRERLGR